MPSGESAPGTTWRPIEAATTPWVPNLKLPATKLSKNIITPQATLQAISVPTCKLLPANECTYRNLIRKTLPWPDSPNGLSCATWPVSYSRYRLTYTVVVNPKSSQTKNPAAARFSRMIACLEYITMSVSPPAACLSC